MVVLAVEDAEPQGQRRAEVMSGDGEERGEVHFLAAIRGFNFTIGKERTTKTYHETMAQQCIESTPSLLDTASGNGS